jgi:hypothetical protein
VWSLDLELRDPPPVEVTDRREMARRGEQAIVEEAQRRRPILSPISRQQRRMPVDELPLPDLLGREERVHAAGLGFAFDRDEVDLDQFRIVEPRSRLLADDQIDAVDLAQAFPDRPAAAR